MLISLKAGALGLNLTVANNVYLMDPCVYNSSADQKGWLNHLNRWWQEGIESQAIDRCNRCVLLMHRHAYFADAPPTVSGRRSPCMCTS